MTSYTKEEWDSRKITDVGFTSALLDILFMGIYLIGGLAFLRASMENTTFLTFGYLAIGMFLAFNAIVVKFFHLMQPRDWYETEITLKNQKYRRNP
jgi:hypothetical protein